MAKTIAKTSRSSGNKTAERTRLYRAVHAACRANHINEDERRAIQSDKFGKASLSDMTVGEIARLLDHLNRNSSRSTTHRAHIGKVRALWWSLYWLGEVDDNADSAITAFVKRQTGVNALRWLDHRSAPAVIEALKAWLERAGVEWPSSQDTASIQNRFPSYTAAHHERTAVIHAQRQRITQRGLGYCSHYVTAYMAGLGRQGTVAVPNLEVAELDGLIRHLGMVIRRGKR